MSEPARAPSRVIVIVGPTAVGKTRLAEDIAVALDGEIVSADSMQVYRGMDVGTAKPPLDARRVRYHCLDLVDPGEQYSAALFQRDAREALRDIAGRGRTPILVGGTGLYVRAALDDMEFPSGDLASEDRAELEALAEAIGPIALHERLREIDPAAAALIHPNNSRRTVRALEMAREGTSYAEQVEGFTQRTSLYPTRFVGMDMDRAQLYARIDARVDAMLAAGLLDEVSRLLASGLREALTASQAIGYKEFVPVVESDADVEAAADEVKRATRRYAKRQLTWFRGDPRIEWLDITDMPPEEATRQMLRLLESTEPLGQDVDPAEQAPEGWE